MSAGKILFCKQMCSQLICLYTSRFFYNFTSTYLSQRNCEMTRYNRSSIEGDPKNMYTFQLLHQVKQDRGSTSPCKQDLLYAHVPHWWNKTESKQVSFHGNRRVDLKHRSISWKIVKYLHKIIPRREYECVS